VSRSQAGEGSCCWPWSGRTTDGQSREIASWRGLRAQCGGLRCGMSGRNVTGSPGPSGAMESCGEAALESRRAGGQAW